MAFWGKIRSATFETVRKISGVYSTENDAAQKEIQCTKDEKPSSVVPDTCEAQLPSHGWKITEIIKTHWKFLAVVVLLLPTVVLVAYSLLMKQGITIMPIFVYPGFMISGCSFLIGTRRRGTQTAVECIPPDVDPPKDEQNTKSESSVQICKAPFPPPPPPPPPSPSPSNRQLDVECRKLLWDVVGRDSLSRSTVWSKMSTNLSAEEIIDVHELSSLFGVSKSPVTKKAIKVLTAKQGIMGTKKKLNIAISLAHIKLPTDKVIDALLQGKADLPTDLLENLLKFAPSEIEDCTLRKQGKKDPSIFSDVERFFYKIITKIPTYKERMRTMLLKAQLQERIDHIQPYLKTIITAINEVRQSTLLREFLQFVLTVGNFMNRSRTQGFKISFLDKLISIKSTVDKKTTFLDFIVKNFKASQPNMLKMIKEMTHVSTAAKINFKHLAFEIDELGRELKLLESDVKMINDSKGLDKAFKENVKIFVIRVHEEFESLVALRNTAFTSLKEVLEYFGEGKGTTMTNEQFFGIITTFLRHLEESLKKHR